MIKYSIPFRGRLLHDTAEVHIAKQLARVGVISNDFLELSHHVDYIYGFVSNTPLNGGRANFNCEITPNDVDVANKYGIKIKVPLSNTLVNKESYQHHTSQELLKFLEEIQGAVVIYSDKLLKWISEDFPGILIEASAVKILDNIEDVNSSLEKYTHICLPVKSSVDFEMLSIIDESVRDRVRVFATSECSFNCPKHCCYSMTSKIVKDNIMGETKNSEEMDEERSKYFCSVGILDSKGNEKYPRKPWWEESGFVFDIEKISNLGYTRFKICNGV